MKRGVGCRRQGVDGTGVGFLGLLCTWDWLRGFAAAPGRSCGTISGTVL